MDIMLVKLLILATLSQSSGWRPFTIEFEDISYEIIHPGFVDLNITRKNQTFDIYFNVLKDIHRPFVDFKLLLDSGNGAMSFANKTIDLCMFLNNRKSNPLFKLFFEMLSEYNELPKRCPLRRKLYKFINVTVDVDKFPTIFPDHRAHASGVGWNKENGQKKILMKGGVIAVVQRSYKSNGKNHINGG